MPRRDHHLFLVSYNRPRLLARTLEALRGQTCRDWRITLVQDGPRHANGADHQAIARCIEIFRAAFPAGEVLARPVNAGIGLNILGAQERAFNELGLEAAFFFEDDLIPHRTYLEQLLVLREALAPYRSFAPYFSCYGKLHAFSPRREQIPGSGLRFMDQSLWAYGLFRDHWVEEQKLLEPYFAYLRTVPYDQRDHEVIAGIFRDLGRSHPVTSQDGARLIALSLLGRCAVTTVPARAVYAGVEGEHSDAASFAAWGFADTLPDDPPVIVPQLSADGLRDAGRAFPRWIDELNELPPNRLARLHATTARQAETISRQQQQIADIFAEVNLLREEVRALRESTSWQFTAPLRWLTDASRRLAWRSSLRAGK